MPKEAAVQAVVEFMNTYSLSQMDMDTILKLSKFQSHPNPIDGIQRAVEAFLAKAYKQGGTLGIVRTNLPGIKKVPKKRVAAILEETDVVNQNDETRPHLDLQTDKLKGIVVKLELKSNEGGMAKKKYAAKAIGSRSSGKRGRGGSSSGKRKR